MYLQTVGSFRHELSQRASKKDRILDRTNPVLCAAEMRIVALEWRYKSPTAPNHVPRSANTAAPVKNKMKLAGSGVPLGAGVRLRQ